MNMYFGSVRFYRHLIFGVMIAAYVVLLSATVILSMKVINNSEVIDRLEEQINEMQETIDSYENVAEKEEETASAQPPADMKYPALYTPPPTEVEPMPPNTVYLTFDDGPTEYTEEILDTLAVYDVKATFYVVGEQVLKYPETVQRMVAEGHAVGLHSDTHKYEQVYSSVDAFLLEFENCMKKVQSVTDYPVTTVRFPGGTNANQGTMIAGQLVDEMTQRGFAIFDWNVDAGTTSSGDITAEEIADNVIEGCTNQTNPIVLMHDTSQETADALDEIVEVLIDMGFQFGVLSNKIEPMYFQVD